MDPVDPKDPVHERDRGDPPSMMASVSASSPTPDSRRYHLLLKIAILMAIGSLVALGVQSAGEHDPDNTPAAFSCSSVPVVP